KAEWATATAALNEALAGPREQTVRAARAELAAAAARLKAETLRVDRDRRLFERGATTRQALDDQEQLVEQLAAEAEAAGERLSELEAGTRPERVDAARARVAAAEALLAQLAVRRTDSEVRAPYECVIVDRLADEGAIAGPSSFVLEVQEVPPMEASFGLPPGLADALEEETGVVIAAGEADQSAPPSPGEETAGPGSYRGAAVVVRRVPAVDPATRTREVVVRFPAEDPSLAGRTATIWVDPGRQSTGEGRYWVPTDSLVRGPRGLWGLYVAAPIEEEGISGNAEEDAAVRLHDAKVIETAGELTLVETALPRSARLIVGGTHKIGPGVRVRPALSGGADDE
ncbi:MAG: hypothetical protein AAF907_16760, partial [Planctomycetota bacterium]